MLKNQFSLTQNSLRALCSELKDVDISTNINIDIKSFL
jgi:hypothetical protein